MNSMQRTRRGFLAYLGLASATAATTAAIAKTVPAPEKEAGPFKHPSRYLNAMHAIGWQAIALFERGPDGAINPMGVKETAPEEVISRTWTDFHAIQMRTPVQRSSEFPAGRWWSDVWQHLYDHGLSEDVTRPHSRMHEFMNGDQHVA